MLFRPTVFLLALLFCLLFNLLSVGMPAWWITRKPIYEALRNGEETNK
jgi:putative ABC transport system permease protein